MSHYQWIFDAGHGGLTKDGKYTTAPGKMHVFEDGMTIYEGVNNRALLKTLLPTLNLHGYDYALVHDEIEDTPLSVRVQRADALYAKNKNSLYVSIHSDAMPEGSHGKAGGASIYTSRGQTKSDKIADIFAQSYMKNLSEFKFRKDMIDGDADTEADFYVLRKTDCPAILIENLFFDNRREAEFLLSEEGRDKIANAIFEAMQNVEMLKPV